MTFKEIQDDALEECAYDRTDTASTPRTRIKRRINAWHRRILTHPQFKRLLRDIFSYSFASVANQTTYGLPFSSVRVHNLYETDNDRALMLKTVDWLRDTDPGDSASGTPGYYIPKGWFPVHTQPSNASAITMKSSNAGDTTQTAYIQYVNAAGQHLGANQMVNGTTDTTLVASDCVEITVLYLDAVCAGALTVYEDSAAGTALAVIPIGRTNVQHQHIRLWPTPGGAITYKVDATRIVGDMANDNEVPSLPEDFHEILSLGAQADEWRLKDDSRYQIVRADLNDKLRDLNTWLWNLSGYSPEPAPEPRRFSRLGSWTPAGSGFWD